MLTLMPTRELAVANIRKAQSRYRKGPGCPPKWVDMGDRGDLGYGGVHFGEITEMESV